MSDATCLWEGEDGFNPGRRRLVHYQGSPTAVWERRGMDAWVPDDSRMRRFATADERMLATALAAREAELAALRAAALAIIDAANGYPSGKQWQRLNKAIRNLAAMLPAAVTDKQKASDAATVDNRPTPTPDDEVPR